MILPVYGFLLALTALRLLVAATVPLSPDEAYYWTWSRALAPGYLDAPGTVAFWIRAGTAFAGAIPLGVRLLAPLSALLGSVLLAAAGRDLLGLDRRHQAFAILLLNATLMVGAGATTITPDTPLLLFWTATLWTLGRLLKTSHPAWLMAAGAALALAFDAKYTALLLLPPLALFLLRLQGWRALLLSPATWAASFLSLLLAAPVVAWNAAHGFASFSKQGGRLLDIHLAAAVRFIPELLGGQLGLATPAIALAFVIGTAQLTRRALRPTPPTGDPGALLVSLAVCLPALVFTVHALGDRVQANWPCVLYPAAALAAAAATTRIRPALAIGTGLAITALVYLQATLHPFPLPVRADPTLAKLAGWTRLAQAVGEQGRALHLPLAADDYALSAELAWHRAAPPVLGFDRRWRFTTLPRTSPAAVLLLRSDHRAGPPDPALFASATPVAHLARTAAGQTAERYTLFRAVPAPGVTAARLPVPFSQL